MLNIDRLDQLTNREVEVLQLLADGWNNKQIADCLCITIRTVKFHTTNIYEKIDVEFALGGDSLGMADGGLWQYL